MTRLLFVLLLAACATPRASSIPTVEPVAVEPVDEVRLRACQSCRRESELCRQRIGPIGASGDGAADCMTQLMACLNQQQLDSRTCAGLN